jgi:hypothetical protein
MRHTFRIGMPEPREAKKGFDHMGEALTRRNFDAQAGVSIARIPPVVPYIRLDGGGLSLAKNARLSAALDGQFTFKNGEAFHYPGMAVFAGDTRSDTRQQFGDRAALGVWWGSSRIVARSRVMGFSQISPIWIDVWSGGPCGSGCDMRITLPPFCSRYGRLLCHVLICSNRLKRFRGLNISDEKILAPGRYAGSILITSQLPLDPNPRRGHRRSRHPQCLPHRTCR